MRLIQTITLLSLCCLPILGCGGAGSSSSVADQDELASFLAENPSLQVSAGDQEEIDPDDNN